MALPDRVAAIEEAFAEADLDRLAMLASELKRAADRCGVPSVVEAAARLEAGARAELELPRLAGQVLKLADVCRSMVSDGSVSSRNSHGTGDRGMPFQPRRRWNEFSQSVQNLRWALVAWMEALLDREVTPYHGSDSFVFAPNSWSKYKLLPYDEEPFSPVHDRAEGVAVCVDLEACEREFGQRLEAESGNVTWLDAPETVRVGSGARTYRLALLPVIQPWEQRTAALRNLAAILRRIEGGSGPAH